MTSIIDLTQDGLIYGIFEASINGVKGEVWGPRVTSFVDDPWPKTSHSIPHDHLSIMYAAYLEPTKEKLPSAYPKYVKLSEATARKVKSPLALPYQVV